VLATAIVTERAQSEYSDMTDVCGEKCVELLHHLCMYGIQQHFRVAGALWGGIPEETAVFDTLIGSKEHQFDCAEKHIC
jgi:hypothetical protein